MNIIVCIKQVPDTTEVRVDPVKGTLIRDGVPSIINPDDKNALEEALRIKEEFANVNITVLSMGPQQALKALVEAIAMGADRGILLNDRAFAGSDTLATSNILASAIRKIGDFDLIFCGRQAIDGDTAQVGPQIAEFLNIPQITYVKNLKIQGSRIVCERLIEDGHFEIESSMPILLTAIKELNEPRYPSIKGVYEAYKGDKIKVWNLDDLDVDRTKIGLKGSPTNVFKSFTAPVKGGDVEFLQGSVEEQVGQLKERLLSENLI